MSQNKALFELPLSPSPIGPKTLSTFAFNRGFFFHSLSDFCVHSPIFYKCVSRAGEPISPKVLFYVTNANKSRDVQRAMLSAAEPELVGGTSLALLLGPPIFSSFTFSAASPIQPEESFFDTNRQRLRWSHNLQWKNHHAPEKNNRRSQLKPN